MPASPVHGFVSYSHKDEKWLKRLRPHLKLLDILGRIKFWDDRSIETGDQWWQNIQTQMNRAQVAILLISPDFLASDFCMKEEIPFFLEKAEAGGLLLVPILLRPCAWDLVPWLESRQMTPRDDRSVAEHYSDQNAYDAFFAKEVAGFIARKLKQSATESPPPAPAPAIPVDITRLPGSGRELFGRKDDLAVLDQAWQAPGTHVVSLVAWGGVGKSALVNRWLEAMARDGWRGAERVFGWSFYSQGTGERVTAADAFIDTALRWFGDPHPEDGSAWDKGERLAALVRQRPTLLVLDGLEPLQWGGGDRGRIKDPALAMLVAELARDNKGLCLITTREPVTDLDDFPETTVQRDLHHLTPQAGRAVLRVRGARGSDAELEAMSIAFGNHALAVSLLAAWLKPQPPPHAPAVCRIPERPDLTEGEGRHPRRVLDAFAARFGHGAEIEVLRLLGLFDRPADAGEIAALRADSPIPNLTGATAGLDEAGWQGLLERLRAPGLLAPAGHRRPDALDAHPLVRKHFAAELRRHHPEAWHAGHERLYRHLSKLPDQDQPDTLAELQPLYLALGHGCAAGRHQEALDEIHRRRIQRGDDAYSFHKLGAFGTELAALADFFDPPWRQPVMTLREADRAELLNNAGFVLRALGRLAEAVEPMQAGLAARIQQENWKNAAIAAVNLSELLVLLGRLAEAEDVADQAVELAERSDDAFHRMARLATRAAVRHQRGRTEAAAADFAEAERRQRQSQPGRPDLYSLRGFQYCDLLLDQDRPDTVRARAEAAMAIAERSHWLLDIALNHLSLGRTQAAADDDPRADGPHFDEAVAGLRRAGYHHHLVRGLLARARFRRTSGRLIDARRDWEEARRIARRGGMRLYQIDADLEEARLALAEGRPEAVRAPLERARAEIEATGYHRRDPEVAELERAVLTVA